MRGWTRPGLPAPNGGRRMRVALELSILNFIVLGGFGLLVPWFAV